jgi:hypothetical protein
MERKLQLQILTHHSDKIQFSYDVLVAQGQKSSIQKIGGYTVSLNHKIHFQLLKSYKKPIHRIRPIITRSNKRLKKFGKCQTSLLKDVKAQQGTVLIFFS